jgi:CopG family nickel-responsive transcriptional regulator
VTEIVRLSFSLEAPLESKLEELVSTSGYTNRSEFIRDMIRDRLVEQQWARGREAVGTITLVYDHDSRGLHDRLVDLQHEHHDLILATTHVHLDRHRCAEMVLARGPAETIRRVAELLRQQKGVLHGTLSMSSTGEELR